MFLINSKIGKELRIANQVMQKNIKVVALVLCILALTISISSCTDCLVVCDKGLNEYVETESN